MKEFPPADVLERDDPAAFLEWFARQPPARSFEYIALLHDVCRERAERCALALIDRQASLGMEFEPVSLSWASFSVEVTRHLCQRIDWDRCAPAEAIKAIDVMAQHAHLGIIDTVLSGGVLRPLTSAQAVEVPLRSAAYWWRGDMLALLESRGINLAHQFGPQEDYIASASYHGTCMDIAAGGWRKDRPIEAFRKTVALLASRGVKVDERREPLPGEYLPRTPLDCAIATHPDMAAVMLPHASPDTRRGYGPGDPVDIAVKKWDHATLVRMRDLGFELSLWIKAAPSEYWPAVLSLWCTGPENDFHQKRQLDAMRATLDFLVEQGMDLSQPDRQGRPILFRAVSNSSVSKAKVLALMNTGLPLAMVDGEGNTIAEHIAALRELNRQRGGNMVVQRDLDEMDGLLRGYGAKQVMQQMLAQINRAAPG